MIDIELTNYKCIIKNEVFGKKTELLNHPITGKVPATLITRLTRFKVPTQDKMIDFIRANAQKIDSDSFFGDKLQDDNDKKTYFLESLPASEIKEIARGNKESLEHLKKHASEDGFQEGRTYIRVISGIVPNVILERARELFKGKGGELYEQAIVNAGASEWNLRIRLLDNETQKRLEHELPSKMPCVSKQGSSYNGRLPDSSELEYLLDRGVKDSDVFYAKGDFGVYQTVINQVRLLYNALPSSEVIAKIADSSYNFLQRRVEETVKETAECIKNKKTIHEIVGVIGCVLSNLKNLQLPESPYEGGGFSLN